jgi:hypothetical protein
LIACAGRKPHLLENCGPSTGYGKQRGCHTDEVLDQHNRDDYRKVGMV